MPTIHCVGLCQLPESTDVLPGSHFFQPHPEDERRSFNMNHDDSVNDDDYTNDDKDVVNLMTFDFPDSEFVMKITNVCHSIVVLTVHQLQYWYAVPVLMTLQM